MASPHHDEDDVGESDSGEMELQHASRQSLCIYLRKELEELDTLDTNINPRAYKEKHLSGAGKKH